MNIITYRVLLKDFKHHVAAHYLAAADGKPGEAAKLLGLSRESFYRWRHAISQSRGPRNRSTKRSADNRQTSVFDLLAHDDLGERS